MSKILVVYFSASGMTARAAEVIAHACDADLYEIRPEQPYTPADLDWRNKSSRSTIEMTNPDSRPEVAGPAVDVAQYDTILVGFPIWWGVEPRIVDAFLEGHDFSGKTLIPFATSGGSSIARAEKSVRAHCPDASWSAGQLVNSANAAQWARTVLQSQ